MAKTTQLILKLDKERHHAFKVKCMGKGETMTSVLEAMIDHYVNNDKLGITVTTKEIRKAFHSDIKLVILNNGKSDHRRLKKMTKIIYGHRVWEDLDGVCFINLGGAFRELVPEDLHRFKRDGFSFIKIFKALKGIE